MNRNLLLLSMLLSVGPALAQGAEPAVIAVAEAPDHIGEEVTVELVVASSRTLESGAFCFLNSRKNFSDKDNFTIAINTAGLQRFAEQRIENPAEFFRGATIRVTGKITLHNDKPQIVVSAPTQIEKVVKIKSGQ